MLPSDGPSKHRSGLAAAAGPALPRSAAESTSATMLRNRAGCLSARTLFPPTFNFFAKETNGQHMANVSSANDLALAQADARGSRCTGSSAALGTSVRLMSSLIDHLP